jgi:ribosome-associated protein
LSTESTALDLARTAGRLALDKKAFDVKILDLTGISSICDYFVIASGDADVQVRAIGRHVYDELAKEGHKPISREGISEGNWVLLDYVDVIVHVFYEPTRRFYALEKLWGDAPVETLTDEIRISPKS